MGWAVFVTIVILAVAFYVIGRFSQAEAPEPDDGHLEDLLGP